MAEEGLGPARIPIEPDLDPLDKGLDDAKKKMEGGLTGLAKKLGPIVGGLFGAALIGKAAGAAKQFLGDSAKMASAEEASVAKLGASVEATGQSYAEAKGKIDAYLDSELARTALDDGDGREAISRLTNATGDYAKALDLMAVTQDLARAKGMDLTAASELVGKVYNGNTAMLARYGIMLDKDATAEEALAAMQTKFAGQAEAYAKTAEGSAKRRAITMGNLREEIGAKLLPVMAKGEELFAQFVGSPLVQKGIDALIGGLGNMADKAIGIVNAFQVGADEGGAGAIFLNVAGEILGKPLPDTWITTVYQIEDAIKTGFATAGTVIEDLKTKWDDLQPTIDRVAGFIQDNATPILAGLGAIVAAVVIPSFIAWAVAAGSAAVATIAAALPVIAVVAAIGAGVALLVAAWENDWGGIATTLTTLWEGTIQPALETLKTWLEINIPVAIQTLTSFWSDTLLPAITAVWTFIQTSLVPMFETLGELLSVTLSVALTALAGLWQNVLLPAVTAVSDWFTNNVIPALESAWSWISEKLSPALETVTGWFDKAKGGLDGLGGVITKVTGWFSTLADKVANFKLPAVLTPGSPTPMEEGLRGIGDAVAALTTQWMNMAAGMGAGQAATIKNIGSAFKDMGKGVKELAGAIKELTTAQGMGGASSLGSFDITPWLEQLDRITSVAMAKIAEITERIGYNKIHKLKLTAARLKEIVQAVLIDFSAMKETALPNLDTWFGQLWDVFDRAATMVNRVRDRVGNNTLIKAMAEAAQSIAGVFAIIQVDLSLDTPGLFFMEKLTGFLANIEAGADFLIPEIRRLGDKWGGTVIDQAADLSQRLSGVFDILGVSSLFKDLTTQDVADPEKTVTVPLLDVITQMMADLELAADAILPGLQTIQDKWGLVLEGVQATAQLLRDVFGGVGEAYKSALDFAAGDTLDLSALSDKLLSLNSATALVLQGVALPTLTAAPGLAATAGGAAAMPTAITVNIYGADGGLRASYTEETNDARVVDIKLSEALGAA